MALMESFSSLLDLPADHMKFACSLQSQLECPWLTPLVEPVNQGLIQHSRQRNPVSEQGLKDEKVKVVLRRASVSLRLPTAARKLLTCASSHSTSATRSSICTCRCLRSRAHDCACNRCASLGTLDIVSTGRCVQAASCG